MPVMVGFNEGRRQKAEGGRNPIRNRDLCLNPKTFRLKRRGFRPDYFDNKFLAAAYEAKADYLVSLDNHLLRLKYYHGTQILTPNLFL
jgi:hypothetical protein